MFWKDSGLNPDYYYYGVLFILPTIPNLKAPLDLIGGPFYAPANHPEILKHNDFYN